ncbi:MAG: ribonuclease Y [Nakamurella sp.]
MEQVLLAVLAVAVVVLVVVLLRRKPAPAQPGLRPDELQEAVRRALAELPSTPSAAAAGATALPEPADGPDNRARVTELERAVTQARAERDQARSRIERTTGEVDDHRAQAEQARREGERAAAERDGLRATVAELQADRGLAHDRWQQEAAGPLAARQAELEAGRERLTAVQSALADDQRRVAADRERLRADEAELERSRIALRESLAATRQQAEDAAAERGRYSELRLQLDGRVVELDERASLVEAELSRVAALTPEPASADVLALPEERSRRDAAVLVRSIEAEAEATAKQRARAIVADAIQRVASDQTAQTVVSVLHLPSDEVKGRIIGREGRNIRAFETITGVNVIIDDTPEAVLLSCFDPVRREVGRVTLEMLVEDGRIHPHRIEESYLRALDEVEALCARAADDALLDVGISKLHPELRTLVGRLKYRTSYGQNVLGHLVETAHIARGMAVELGVDPKVVTRGAFLHDIGKALTHEAQGSHAIVGAELARKYGESEDVAHCIEAHHDEVAPATVEAVLTQAADSCSGGRPGARRESLESYVQRLERIEAIASAKKGVEKVFAMQAGRELRVMVKPEIVDDLEAHVLAREVAKQIEEELTYPGPVGVTVIRVSRATEDAR